MNYCLSIVDNFIVGICESEHSFENSISEDERNSIRSLMLHKPKDPDGYQYKLRADNLEWELVELPPSPEPEYEPSIEDKSEAYDILLGGAE